MPHTNPTTIQTAKTKPLRVTRSVSPFVLVAAVRTHDEVARKVPHNDGIFIPLSRFLGLIKPEPN
jgi:hypothetical protein